MIGQTFAHYRILDKLGHGGMGVVYAAEDQKLGRRVALKFLPAELSKNPHALERFRREARAASSLNHPNICTIHDIAEHDGQIFLVMELLEGQTLREAIAQRALPLDSLLDIGIQLTDALEAAHKKGIVHRDIKPANIFLSLHGSAKLMDFGLAKVSAEDASPGQGPETLDGGVRGSDSMGVGTTEEALTTPGVAMGTVAYMSPEQARGEELDARTDLFSFGAVLYEMATGHIAFRGSTAAVVFHAILETTPKAPSSINPSLPAKFDEIVSKVLEKDRALRYQSAAEIGADLKRLKRDSDTARIQISSKSGPVMTTAPRNNKLRMGLLAAMLSIAVVLGLTFLFIAKRSSENTMDSVAVLPFVNATGNADTEYLSEGITQGLINTLSQLPNVKVVSLISAFRYKGKSIDPPQVARELGVHTILTGRMIKQGDTFSISAELVDAEHDRQMWGKQYQRKLSGVDTLQSEIAHDITDYLKMNLSGAQKSRMAQRSTENSEAYQLYLQGRYYWNRRTAMGTSKSIDYFQQAIAKDPNFALAYSGLADSYISLARNSATLSPKEGAAKTRQAAEKAIELDPSLGEAHASLAMDLMVFDWDFASADREFKRAIELNPTYPYAHNWYSELLYSTGRSEDSVVEARKSVELEPFTPILRHNLGLALMYVNQYGEAEKEFNKVIEMDPNFPLVRYGLAEVLIHQGKLEQAVSEMEKMARYYSESSFYRAVLGYTLARAGKIEEARKILGELTEEANSKYVSWLGIAYIYVGLNEEDHSITALELAYQQGDSRMNTIRARSVSVPAWRADPRFSDFLKRMGLPPLEN